MLQLLFVNLFESELDKTKPDACNPPSPGGVSFFQPAIPYFLYLEPVLTLPAWAPVGLSFAMALAVWLSTFAHLFCDHPEATLQDLCRSNMHQIPSVPVLWLAGQALILQSPSQMPRHWVSSAVWLHPEPITSAFCQPGAYLLPGINSCFAAMHNQSFKFLGRFITISLSAVWLVFFIIIPRRLWFWELLHALLCFPRSHTLMERQILTSPPPFPPVHVNQANWSNWSSTQCSVVWHWGWEMNWQVGKPAAQFLHFGKFIHNRFPLVESPGVGLSVCFLFLISQDRAAQCCSEGQEENNQRGCRALQSAPPQKIPSKRDEDPSGGWPDTTSRGRNSLSSSFHIY